MTPNPPNTPLEFDKHDLYELCVQSTEHLAPLLRAIHGGDPLVLAEDFAGTAALSHEWAELRDDATAVAVDLDAEALNRHGNHPRVTKHECDVRDVRTPANLIFVGNFSIGYLHTRRELIGYLKHARERLATDACDEHRESQGVFICDTYGGDGSFVTGGVHRNHPLPDGRIVRYTWEQVEADPLTGMVTNTCSFRVERSGLVEQEFDDAFVYRWRLWSVPELRDAMEEAGFVRTEVYAKLADAMDEDGNAYVTPVDDPETELEESFVVLICARLSDTL